MQFLEEIWKLLFLAQMPWQLIAAIVVIFVFIPCAVVKLIPCLFVILLYIISFTANVIIWFFLFTESQVSQFLRKCNKNPPFIVYIAGDALVTLKKSIEFLLSKAKSFSPKKWYSLPFIVVFAYFSYQYHYIDILFDNTVRYWHELNKYTHYKVKDGDCLGKIAQQYHVPMPVIISENSGRYPSLTYNPDDISKGWVLRIPRYYSSGIKND